MSGLKVSTFALLNLNKMKKLVEYTPTELDNIITEYEVLKKENHANRWTDILAVIVIFGLLFWISELIYQRDSALIESANYKAISEKQKEYFSTQLDTMVFYNECGIRINLKENE
jgi:hypothetical protein